MPHIESSTQYGCDKGSRFTPCQCALNPQRLAPLADWKVGAASRESAADVDLGPSVSGAIGNPRAAFASLEAAMTNDRIRRMLHPQADEYRIHGVKAVWEDFAERLPMFCIAELEPCPKSGVLL
jgi:hypothetical protein